MVWWGKDKEKSSASTAKPEPSKAEKEVPQKTFDPDKLPERRKLPKKLQRIVDKADQDDSFYDELVSG